MLAGRHCLLAAAEVGGAALLIDARNERVAGWYEAYGQYTSLNYSNCLTDDDRLLGRCVTSAEWPVAHLSFDATRIAPAAAAGDSLLQNLREHSLMKGFPLHRGE